MMYLKVIDQDALDRAFEDPIARERFDAHMAAGTPGVISDPSGDRVICILGPGLDADENGKVTHNCYQQDCCGHRWLEWYEGRRL